MSHQVHAMVSLYGVRHVAVLIHNLCAWDRLSLSPSPPIPLLCRAPDSTDHLMVDLLAQQKGILRGWHPCANSVWAERAPHCHVGYMGCEAENPRLGSQTCCGNPTMNLDKGLHLSTPNAMLVPCQLQHSRILVFQLSKFHEWSLKSICCCPQINFVFVLLFLPSFLFCYTKFVCSLAFPVQKLPRLPAGFTKKTPLCCPSWGNARPADGALGLFTLRRIITERWIRSYLRSAFSQSSLATQPLRYKYTPETCTDSYSELRPSEAWGADAAREQGHQEIPRTQRSASLAASRSKMAPIKHDALRTLAPTSNAPTQTQMEIFQPSG